MTYVLTGKLRNVGEIGVNGDARISWVTGDDQDATIQEPSTISLQKFNKFALGKNNLC